MRPINLLAASLIFIVSLTSLNAFSTGQGEIIPIVYDYPDCNYKVLKKILLKDVVLQHVTSGDDPEPHGVSVSENNELLLLKQVALLEANELGAHQIVLLPSEPFSDTNRAVETTSTAHNVDHIASASLIGNCNKEVLSKIEIEESSNARGEKTTLVRMTHEFSTVIEGRDMTFDFADLMQNGEKEIEMPALEDEIVSFESGAFGVKVNDELTVLVAKLGIPTAELILNKTDTLFVYGRNLWVVVRNNKVHKIQSQNIWLSTELINYFEFDERPFLSWQVNGSIGRGEDLKVIETQLDGTLKEEYTFRVAAEGGLFIDVGLTIQIDGNDINYIAKDFAYGYLDDSASVIASEIVKPEPSIHQQISSDLMTASQNVEPITIGQFPFTPILSARGYEDTTLQVYDSNIAMVYENNHMKKIIIRSAFFRNTAPKREWIFGALRAGSSEEDVKATFGEENIFALADVWEIYTDNLKYELYFAKNEQGDMVLDELEVEMF